MARGISLHIGLNGVDPDHYSHWDGALAACEADANAMEALAQGRDFSPTKLLTQQATADAILANRLYVLPHRAARDSIRRRFERIDRTFDDQAAEGWAH